MRKVKILLEWSAAWAQPNEARNPAMGGPARAWRQRFTRTGFGTASRFPTAPNRAPNYSILTKMICASPALSR
jgi:hypothetical protein